jgi:Flp pilus assembly protein TadD
MARSVAANALLAFSCPLDVRPLLVIARRSSPRFPEPGKLVGYSEVSVWDPTLRRPLFPPLHEDKATQLAWLSPDGQRLLTYKAGERSSPRRQPPGDGNQINMDEARDSEFVLRDAQTGKPVLPPRLLAGTAGLGVISPDGRRIAVHYSLHREPSPADRGPGRWTPEMPARKTEVWDMSTLQTIATLELPQTAGALLSVEFNGEGNLLLANVYNAALIYDASTGRCLRELPVKNGSACTCAVFSPDFARILVGTRQGTARVYDTRSGEPLTPPLEHGNPMHNGYFSPDGRLVLTFSADGAFRLWDASNGDPVTPAPGANSGEDPQRPRKGLYSSGVGYDMVHFGIKGDYLWVLDPDESREPWLLRFDCRLDTRPLAELIAVVESLAGRRLAVGGFALLDAAQIRSRQQGLRPSAGLATPLQAVTWHRREADRCIRADQWGAAIEQLNLAAALTPAQAWPHRTLGLVYAQQERWVEAVAAFGRAAERRPQGEDAALQAMARLAGGDLVGYHQECQDLVQQFKRPEDPEAADVLASLCLLDTGTGSDWTAPLVLEEKAAAANATDPGYQATLGGILYRAGRPVEAITRLKQAVEMGNNDRSTWALLALAHHAAGHSDEARACLLKARATPDHMPDIIKPRLLLWMIRLSSDVPLREAESQIK